MRSTFPDLLPVCVINCASVRRYKLCRISRRDAESRWISCRTMNPTVVHWDCVILLRAALSVMGANTRGGFLLAALDETGWNLTALD